MNGSNDSRRVDAMLGAELIEMEIMPNRAHPLVGSDPQFGLHRLINLLKGRSS
jgi:putative transposase